jgi:RimK family alpha-L-glutamate ligase
MEARSPYKPRRLREELAARGHNALAVDFADIQLHTGPEGLHLLLKGKPFPRVHSIYWMHDWNDREAFVIMQALEVLGAPLFWLPSIPMGDKVTQALLLSQAGLPIPSTWICTTPEDIDARGVSFPCVLKGRYGSQGRKIRWVESSAQLPDRLAEIQDKGDEGEPFVLQQPVYPLGQDVRAFVVGDSCIAAIERHAQKGDFRANFSLGGDVKATRLTPQEEDMVLKAHRVMQSPISGVDFIRTEHGPVLLEVNMWPGFEGLEKATSVNVAAKIIDYMEEKFSARA